jgi:formylmethanofuran dehydrogenase subunit E-like metal-binding protein
MKGIKGVSAYKINKSRNSKGELWQQESFDRIIRDEKEYNEKMTYMYYNPFKKELVDDPEKYEWWYLNEEIY